MEKMKIHNYQCFESSPPPQPTKIVLLFKKTCLVQNRWKHTEFVWFKAQITQLFELCPDRWRSVRSVRTCTACTECTYVYGVYVRVRSVRTCTECTCTECTCMACTCTACVQTCILINQPHWSHSPVLSSRALYAEKGMQKYLIYGALR